MMEEISRRNPASTVKLSRSKPEPTTCKDCGLVVEPRFYGTDAFGMWFSFEYCPDCSSLRDAKILMNEKCSKDRIELRKSRLVKWSDKIKLAKKIPLLYRQARIGKINKKLAKLLTSQSVFLWGGTGTGKTYATIAILRYGIIRGRTIIRVKFDDLMAEFRQFEKTEDDVLSKYNSPQTLIVDDIGQSNSDFARRMLYRIIDYRLEWEKHTIATSNLSIEHLKPLIGERLFSRFNCFKIVKIDGKDRRVKYE